MNWDYLLMPFKLAFMTDAFTIGVIIAIPCALLSCFLVLKGWSLMGDAVSHAVLPGIVLAYLVGLPILVGAMAAGMLCAVSTGWIADNSRVKRDTVLGVIFSGMFGFGVVLFTAVTTSSHLDHILYGNLMGVQPKDLQLAIVAAVLIGGWIIIKWRDLLLHSFDENQARAAGLRTGWLHYGLLIALSGAVVSTLAAVGIILAIGLLIAPGAIAFLSVRKFSHMLIVAPVVTIFSMLVGIYASFFLESEPAPTVILVLTIIFLIAFARRTITQSRATATT